ncbi:MAG TPA: type II secretion system F family protein [Candidatus Aquabacterium excrementipullorum]|nr:type II secretion system F family protein [Candidatus Aquabacterium excrementipullorum]
MSRFTYTARSPLGVVNGVQDAASASAVADILTSKGLTPLSIKQDGGGSSASAGQGGAAGGGLSGQVSLPGFLGPKVTQTDLMIFTRQIHTLLKAGVPILRALAGLHDTAINPAMKQTLMDLRRSLESGVELSSSMALNPKVFDNFYVSMVKVGESSGRLEEVFLRLFEHLEFEVFMRQQVKSAMRYPTFVIIAMVAALGVINVMVIPAFANVFKSFGANLPLPTRILMATSNFTINHGWLLLVMAVGAFIGFRMWIKTPEGRMAWHKTLLKMPLVGPIVSKAALARFARAFALSLRSGVPLERALTGVAYTADNVYMSSRIEALRDSVTRGEPLAHAAAMTGIFTPIVLQMIAIGEETGMVDDLLEEVGDLYGNEVQYALKTLSQQIEPILIVFLGVVVLILALGVFLPMWDLSSVALKK